MRSRSCPGKGRAVGKATNNAVSIPKPIQDEFCGSRPKSQLEEETGEALRVYRSRLSEVEAAENALRRAVEEEQLVARDLDPHPSSSHAAANGVRLLAEYRNALHQLATGYSIHNAAQRHLNAAREHYIVLETQLGFIPEL